MGGMRLPAILKDHALYVLLGLAAVCTMIWLCLLRKRLSMKWYTALLLAIAHVAYGVFCVKVFAFAESGFAKEGFGAMSLFGAVFLMPPAYYLGARCTKRPVAEVFDLFAIPMIFTLLCARCNCLVAGCCQGRMIPGLAPWRWPTRELEVVFYLIFLALEAPKVIKGVSRGLVYPRYMAAYGSFRFVIECFRTANTNSLFHVSHIWAVISLAIGFGILLEIKQQEKRNANQSFKQQNRKKR